MKEKIKILFLITDFKLGGAQSVMTNLVKNINQEEFIPFVACLFGGNTTIAKELRAKGIIVKDLGMTHFWRVDALWRLYRLIKQQKVQILHASLFHASIAARIIGKMARVPIIISWRHNIFHGSYGREVISKLTSFLDDAVTAVSLEAKNAEIKSSRLNKDKIQVIYNGVSTEKFCLNEYRNFKKLKHEIGIKDYELNIGYIGRINPVKSIDTLLEAFMILSKSENKDMSLLIVGEGETRNKLKNLSISLGIMQEVYFLGSRNDVPQILSTLDIFVLPSKSEGMPMVILEAMAAGLPVVATNVGGTPEVVIDGETGFLVPPGDPQALADVIKKLMDDPELRRKFGKAGRERVEKHFTIEETVRKTEELYLRLLKEKGIQA